MNNKEWLKEKMCIPFFSPRKCRVCKKWDEVEVVDKYLLHERGLCVGCRDARRERVAAYDRKLPQRHLRRY